jgi:Fur family peroxide stress response transcriptional regulator
MPLGSRDTNIADDAGTDTGRGSAVGSGRSGAGTSEDLSGHTTEIRDARPGEARAEAVEAERAAVRGVLKSNGLRYSRPREAILAFLLEEDRHVSAEGLYLNLKQRGEDLSLSTVYLNLAALAEAGLVCEFRGASGESLYDSNVSPHYHVVCKETGAILDVPAPIINGKPLGRYLKDAIEAATGWQVDEPHLSLSGISPDAKLIAASAPTSD